MQLYIQCIYKCKIQQLMRCDAMQCILLKITLQNNFLDNMLHLKANKDCKRLKVWTRLRTRWKICSDTPIPLATPSLFKNEKTWANTFSRSTSETAKEKIIFTSLEDASSLPHYILHQVLHRKPSYPP